MPTMIPGRNGFILILPVSILHCQSQRITFTYARIVKFRGLRFLKEENILNIILNWESKNGIRNMGAFMEMERRRAMSPRQRSRKREKNKRQRHSSLYMG